MVLNLFVVDHAQLLALLRGVATPVLRLEGVFLWLLHFAQIQILLCTCSQSRIQFTCNLLADVSTIILHALATCAVKGARDAQCRILAQAGCILLADLGDLLRHTCASDSLASKPHPP